MLLLWTLLHCIISRLRPVRSAWPVVSFRQDCNFCNSHHRAANDQVVYLLFPITLLVPTHTHTHTELMTSSEESLLCLHNFSTRLLTVLGFSLQNGRRSYLFSIPRRGREGRKKTLLFLLVFDKRKRGESCVSPRIYPLVSFQTFPHLTFFRVLSSEKGKKKKKNCDITTYALFLLSCEKDIEERGRMKNFFSLFFYPSSFSFVINQSRQKRPICRRCWGILSSRVVYVCVMFSSIVVIDEL